MCVAVWNSRSKRCLPLLPTRCHCSGRELSGAAQSHSLEGLSAFFLAPWLLARSCTFDPLLNSLQKHHSAQAEPLVATRNPQSSGLTLNVSLLSAGFHEEERFTYRGLNQNFRKNPLGLGDDNFSAFSTMSMHHFFKQKNHATNVI